MPTPTTVKPSRLVISVRDKDLHTWLGALDPGMGNKLSNEVDRWRNSLAVHASIPVVIGSMRFNAWVDTCSPITIISKSLLDSQHLSLLDVQHVTQFKGLSKNSSTLNFLGVAQFITELGGVSMQTVGAVVEQGLPAGCDLILGRYDFNANNLGISVLHSQVLVWKGDSMADIVAASQPKDWIAAVTPIAPPSLPSTAPDELSLESDRILTAAGEYYVLLRANSWIPPKDAGIGWAALVNAVDNRALPDTISLYDEWGELITGLMDVPSRTVKLKIRKFDNATYILPKGLVLGRIVDTIAPSNQQPIALSAASRHPKGPSLPEWFSTGGRTLYQLWGSVIKPPDRDLVRTSGFNKGAVRSRPWLKRARKLWSALSLNEQAWIDNHPPDPVTVGGLVGSTTDALKTTTEASKSLDDPTVVLKAVSIAQRCIKEWATLSPTAQEELKQLAVGKRKEGKEFQLATTPLPVQESPPPGTWPSLAGSHVWKPGIPSEEGDDPEIQAAVDNMSMAGETIPELTDLEFFVAFGCTEFKHHSGLSLTAFPGMLQKAVTNIFRYREAGLFRLNYNKQLPTIKGVKYEVHMKDGEESRPFDSGRRKYSDMETREICRQVMQLIQSGVLSPTRSAWSSSLILVSKSDGGIRMCVDLRGINSKTLHVASQLPLVADVLQDSFTNGDVLFAQLDLSQAYHQLEVTQASKQFLAFKLPRVSAAECEKLGFSPPFQVTWNRVPFGLSDAVTSFSNLVMSIFQPAGFSPYLDDLGFGAATTELMTSQLEQIFRLAAVHGLTFGVKCTVYASQISFLGHVVSSKGVSPDPKRIEAITNSPTAFSSVAEVRTFLGVVAFCQQFCGIDYASMAAPLTDLLKDPTRATFEWLPEHSKAVLAIKTALTTAPTLKLFDNTLETCITTDGSVKGVGASLLQKHGEQWLPVFFLGKKLSEVQARWNTTQYELFAIVLALEKWKRFLIDKPFTVLTDHEALKYLQNPKLFTGRRLTRWQLLLSEYRFDMRYKAGPEMGLPDFISRHPPTDEDVSALVAFISGMTTPTEPASTVASLRVFAEATHTAVLQATICAASIIMPLFAAGDRVSTINPSWGHCNGTCTSRNRKGAGKKAEWWNVLFDPDPTHDRGAETWPVAATSLSAIPPKSSLEGDPPLSESIIQPGLQCLAETSSNHPSSGLEGDSLNPPIHSREDVPVSVATGHDITTSWEVGDVVQVKIGHQLCFRPTQSLMLPLGRIECLTSENVSIRLLLEGRPLHVVNRSLASKFVSLIISYASLKSTTHHLKNVAYDIGDVVLVVNTVKKNEINTTLLHQKVILVPETYLTGIVLSKTEKKDTYDIHFGSLETGVFSLQQTDVALLASGHIPILSDLNRGQVPQVPSLSGSSGAATLWTSLTSNVENSVKEDWLIEVALEQTKDPVLSAVIQYLKNGTLSPLWTPTLLQKAHKLRDLYSLDDVKGILRLQPDNQLVIPVTLVPTVCSLVHDLNQHFDWHKSYDFSRKFFYIRGGPEIIRRYVGSCLTCQRTRSLGYFTRMYGQEIAERVLHFKPGKHWAIDLKQIPADDFGFKYLLVMIDLCTQFVIVTPIPNKTKEVVMLAVFTDLLARFGAGDLELVFDQGSEFMNEFVQSLMSDYLVTCTPIQTRHAQGNGMVEQFMDIFNDHFAKAMKDKILSPSRWSEWVVLLVATLNGLYKPVLGNSPFYLMFQREFILQPAHRLLTDDISPSKRRRIDTQEGILASRHHDHLVILQMLKARLRSSQKNVEMERAFANQVPSFAPGDLVLVLLGDSNGGYLFKNRAHAGPFKVDSRASTSTYLVHGNDSKLVSIHGFKLLPYEPSLADMLGHQGLAHSAVGAAAARLFHYDKVTSSSSSAVLSILADSLEMSPSHSFFGLLSS